MSDTPQSIAQQLSNPEKQFLNGLKVRGGLNGPVRLTGDDAQSARAVSWLQAKGILAVEEEATHIVALDKEGREYAEKGFPEDRLYAFVKVRGASVPLGEVRNKSTLTSEEIQIALAWWKRKKMGELMRQGAETLITIHPSRAPSKDEAVLAKLRKDEALPVSALDQEGLEMLRGRKDVLRVSERKERTVRLTPLGQEVAALDLLIEEEIGQLTPELIRSGAWRNKAIRPYDVSTPAPRMHPGKPHPLVQLIEEIRDIFLELGFQEIEEEFVVPTLWNMDALFIPQDHPAREMQDTFYLDVPSRLAVDPKVVDLVRKMHETGGGTGSRGWGGSFDPKESERALLRTHTTVGTIRHLAKHPEGPLRVFSIGRVFRKETMDATHLPEFHQIEGIATEPGADFPMLLGILKEFYKRLGFETLRWRPAYFPYTEPSMEVEVWTGTRWMELGGCGIFRPEVSQPFGVKTPVLAWGLGLERLAMLRFGLNDIRQIYWSDIEWLRRQPLL